MGVTLKSCTQFGGLLAPCSSPELPMSQVSVPQVENPIQVTQPCPEDTAVNALHQSLKSSTHFSCLKWDPALSCSPWHPTRQFDTDPPPPPSLHDLLPLPEAAAEDVLECNATSVAIRPGSLCPQPPGPGTACTPFLVAVDSAGPCHSSQALTPFWSQRAGDGQGQGSGTLPVPRTVLQTHLVTAVFIKGFLSQK